jgi:homoserine dehydrogenase
VSAPTRGPGPLRVGLLGLGTVGREVARGLLDRGAHIASAAGHPIELVAVGVRDPGRDRGVRFPRSVRLTDDLASIAADPSLDVVVELLGGLDPAGAVVEQTLRDGRGIVTANKALLAARGPELERLAREQGAPLRFEAAVGGGIPVLTPLAFDLGANRVRRIRGIVNGTTNYILAQIQELQEPFETVLAEAQALGYAEADPRSDVEGDDAVHKLVLLARLAFGGWLDATGIVKRLPTVRGIASPGITPIRYEDLEAANTMDHEIKLIAEVSRADDGTITASVVPTLVPSETRFAQTDGVDNRIEVEADPLGRVGFDGPGAGGPQTSSAVIGDLLAIARGEMSTWGGLPPAEPVGIESGAAGADLLRERAWFVFLPDVSADELGRAFVGETAERPTGTAVMTTAVDVQRLRRGLARILPEGVDPVLYPVMEPED